MFRNLMSGLIVCVLVFAASAGASFAESYGSDAKTGASVAVRKQEVGNKICPVSGEEVGAGGMEPVRYEYEGKIYNLCCTGCIAEFKNNPEKYIRIVEEEMKNQKAAAGK
jgi:YHS domain-containing protein